MEALNLTPFEGNIVFFNLTKAYRALLKKYGTGKNIPESVLYEAARRAWVMADWRKPLVKFAAIVFEGTIVEVYEVQSWQPFKMPNGTTRAEFTGTPISGAGRANYVGKPADPHMPRGATFVVAYNFK